MNNVSFCHLYRYIKKLRTEKHLVFVFVILYNYWFRILAYVYKLKLYVVVIITCNAVFLIFYRRVYDCTITIVP